MGVTALSFLVLPLTLIWMGAPTKLLKLVPFFAIFEAAAALVLGSLGVQSSLIPAAGFIGFMLLQILLGSQFSGGSQVWQLARPFVIVTAWAVISSVVMPRMFEGQVYVQPQKPTPPFLPVPIEPNAGNLNQDLYLLVDCMFFVLAAMFFRSRFSQLSLAPFLRCYLLSGFAVAAIAVWQFASKVAGVPFPGDVFYSNPGWSILTTQSIGLVPRINGSFAEPSALATYMFSFVCSSGWLMLQGHRDTLIRWLFGVAVLTMMLSTSATGLAVLAIVGVGVPALSLLSGSYRMASSILRIGIPFLIVAGMAFFTAQVFIPRFDENVDIVISSTTSKADSSSYNDRTSADVDSLVALVDSYCLGVGWGSNRSSSLVPGLLASLGVPGFLGLVWFGVTLTRKVRLARRQRCTRDQMFVMDGCCGGLVGFLLPAVVSAPSITTMTFFFLLALLVGCTSIVLSQSNRQRVAGPAVPRRAVLTRHG